MVYWAQQKQPIFSNIENDLLLQRGDIFVFIMWNCSESARNYGMIDDNFSCVSNSYY